MDVTNQKSVQLPQEIVTDLGSMLAELGSFGFVPTNTEFSPQSFGNYFVDFQGPRVIRIVRDRSQYYLGDCAGGPTTSELKLAQLFGAINDREQFAKRLLAWVSALAK